MEFEPGKEYSIEDICERTSTGYHIIINNIDALVSNMKCIYFNNFSDMFNHLNTIIHIYWKRYFANYEHSYRIENNCFYFKGDTLMTGGTDAVEISTSKLSKDQCDMIMNIFKELVDDRDKDDPKNLFVSFLIIFFGFILMMLIAFLFK
jgi:hypothetical protein